MNTMDVETKRSTTNSARTQATKRWHAWLDKATLHMQVFVRLCTVGVPHGALARCFGDYLANAALGFVTITTRGRDGTEYIATVEPHVAAYVLLRNTPQYAKRTKVYARFLAALCAAVDDAAVVIATDRLVGKHRHVATRDTLPGMPEAWWGS